MNYLEKILSTLKRASSQAVLQEVRNGELYSVSGNDLLGLCTTARIFLKRTGIRKSERCVLLASNSIHWTAMDLALMAEGIVTVPLYSRQAPAELVVMIKDSEPSLIIYGSKELRSGISKQWSSAPRSAILEEIFQIPNPAELAAGMQGPAPLASSDPVAIIYTSGTSGETKGVILTVGNLNHMLKCTTSRLDLLMGNHAGPEKVFHYLPCSFAGSWISLLSYLSRNSVLTLSTDLSKLLEEMRLAAPEYFLNVPALLERVRTGIGNKMKEKGGLSLRLFVNATKAWYRRTEHKETLLDLFWLALGRAFMFPLIRKSFGQNLKALICGSAPLPLETQLFFQMLGLPVLQVYGLTETTAICTMDDPRHIVPGRVGPAIDGIEMKIGESGEILVRGPNIFTGYWNKPTAIAEVLRDGWFHTGDTGEHDESGNWIISGRIKDLLILNSGHNIAPEPIEEILSRALNSAMQVVLVGNGRSYMIAIVTGSVSSSEIETVISSLNQKMPHYKRIRGFYIAPEPFTMENGLLTANGKLKRDSILKCFQQEVDALYQQSKL